MVKVISESDFSEALKFDIEMMLASADFRAVTGPGRSGAIAAVYASHILGIPFIPYGQKCPPTLQPLLIIDTASQTGKTLRKASNKYDYVSHDTHAVFYEPPRVIFWYEKEANEQSDS